MIAIDSIETVADLARELGIQGHQVTVHTRREVPGKRRTTLATGVVVDYLAAGPEAPVVDVLPYVGEFADRLAAKWADQRPDVVHAYGRAGGLAAASACAAQNVPLVQSYGLLSSHLPPADRLPQARLERALGRTADACIVGCLQDKDELVRLGVPRSQIRVVPQGVDTEEFSEHGPAYPGGRRKRLVMVHGPAPETGAGAVVQALSRFPGAELVIAGGPPQDELESDADAIRLMRLARTQGVDDRVILLGQVARKQMPRLFRSADLVLALPAYDPHGTVALEAMSCGVPVAAVASGGYADTVIDNVTGILLKPCGPAELAARLRTLFADPVHLEALGIAAADRTRSRNSWTRIATETAALYERVAPVAVAA
ncbi:MAG: glycosyltransferase [Streptosporangiaceae bacterium]